MKKRISTRVLSVFLAVVMVILMMPFSAITVFAEEESLLPQIDYTPFLIESVNEQAIYNSQTADLSYDFYKAAKAYVDDNASSTIKSIKDGDFSFIHKGISYTLNSVYINKPTGFWDSTCGMLIGIFNYTFENQTNYIMMVMFEGTKGKWDVFTDLSFAAQKVDSNHWYHNGFYEAAHNHYNILSEQKFSLGNEEVTLLEYIDKLKNNENNCQMLITGHSLGAATANIFASYFIDTLGGDDVQKNVAAYTFATPLTCFDGTANNSTVKNVFNFINKWDWVPKVGYGGAEALDLGAREGLDFEFTAGSSDWKDKQPIFGKKFLNFTNHKMSSYVYGSILEQVNYTICDKKINPYGRYVLYNNYDSSTHTHQRIIFNNGQLIVSGSGVLPGNWKENTLVEWAKVKDSCTSLVFETDCTIAEIGDYAFAGMDRLANELDLPNTITKIGNYAFFHCGFNGDLIIPAGMKSVGISAFNGCSNFDSINAQAACSMTWGYGAFANCVHTDYLTLPIEDLGVDLGRDIFSTYYVEDNSGIYRISVEDSTTGNVVLPGDKIYYGRLLDEQIGQYPTFDFHYFLTEGNVDIQQSIETQSRTTIENVASIDEFGCVTVEPACEANKEFTVVVLYDSKGNPNYSVRQSTYYIHFTVGAVNNSFEGGLGTKERPYLIKNGDQLKRIKDDLSVCYKIIADINFNGESISPLGTLTGTLDGNGFSIYNFIINKSQEFCGLFNEIATDAKVQNLTIGKNEYTTKVTYSDRDATYAYYGILAGKNAGDIINCNAENVDVSISIKKTSNGRKYATAGGLIGLNTCNIINSGVYNSRIFSYSKSTQSHNQNAYGNAGGICGNATGGNISYCFSFNNAITAGGYGYKTGFDKSTAHSYVGGIIGGGAWESNSNSVSGTDVKVGNNILTTNATSTKGTCTNQKGDYFGCTMNIEQTGQISEIPTNQFNLELVKKPHKTNYYIGESLNLFGLIVKDNKNNWVNGYTVNGFNSNKSGEQKITVSYQSGYNNTPLTATFTVNVENIIPQSVIVRPQEPSYNINDELSVNDFTAIIYYNDGTTETMESLAENVSDIVKFTAFSNLLDTKGTQVLQLNYHYAYMTVDGKAAASASIVAYVAVIVNCDCLSTTILNAMPATVSEYGYTGDLICSTCQSIVEEGTIIDMLECTNHNYGVWENHDITQHSRVCACGEVEYAAHNWDDGTITTPATYEKEGERTYTCLDCEAIYIVPIPKPVGVHLFVVDDASAIPGGTMQVDVRLENNPGIAMMRLKISYDSSVLTLNQVTYNTEIGGTETQPTIYDGYVTLLWYNDSENVEGDWIFATLSFIVKDTATVGSVSDIVLTYNAEEVCDIEENNVVFSIDNGSATVLDHVPGDINGDGGLTSKDLLRLARYFAGWDVEVNKNALDINGDGSINSKDLLRLARYFAGWNVEIH